MANRAYGANPLSSRDEALCTLTNSGLQADAFLKTTDAFKSPNYGFYGYSCYIEGLYLQHQKARDWFKATYNQWLRDSRFDSLPDRMRRHKSYKDIVAMGDRVVPSIAAELRREPSFLFLALQDITGRNPVPTSAQGDLRATIAAWLSCLRK